MKGRSNMSINIAITGKNIKITDAIRKYVTEEVNGLEKYFENIIGAHVILIVEKERKIAEITLNTSRNTLHIDEVSDDMYKSIDAVVDHLARQLKQIKEKMIDKKRQFDKTKFTTQNMEKARDGIETDEGHHIVLVDRYVKKPMTVQEAAMQLEMVENDFLVFYNMNADHINVIYKRKNGDFGLINPDF